MTRLMKRMSGALWLLWAFLAALSGCGGPGSLEPGEELSTKDTLQALRAAHGASRWSAMAGVRFSYLLSTPPKGQALSLDVAFRRDDLLRLWVAPGPGRTPLRLQLDAPRGALVEALVAGGVLSPGERDDLGSTLDDSLRGIRYSFSLPLTTLQGRWEFRGLTAPPGVPRPAVLEVFPLEPGVPFTRSWIVRDARTGLLSRVLYEVPDGILSGGHYEVTFDGYDETAGIPVARSRRHVPVESRRPAGAPVDPFFRMKSQESRARRAFAEEVLNVAFLSGADVDVVCPMPSEKSAPGAPEGPAQ